MREGKTLGLQRKGRTDRKGSFSVNTIRRRRRGTRRRGEKEEKEME